MGLDTESIACLYAQNEIGRFFLHLIANMLFVSINSLAGKVNLGSQQYFFKLMYFYFYVLDQI